MSRFHIGIIGGGSAGLITAINILRRCDDAFVTLFESSNAMGGLGFASNDRQAILNTPVHLCSAIPNDPNHFADFLRKLGLNPGPNDFVPRHYVADYLICLLSDNFSDKAKVVYSPVADVNLLPNGKVSFELNEGAEFIFDAGVLAIGTTYGAVGSSIAAYPNHWIDSVDPDRPIFIQGTSVSAVDICLSLLRSKHNSEIVMFSNSGLLPSVRSRIQPGDCFDGCIDLAELSSLFAHTLPTHQSQPSLGQDIDQCLSGQNHWQDAIAPFLNAADRIWGNASMSEKRAFWDFNSKRCRRYISAMPLASAMTLMDGMATNRVRVTSKPPKHADDYFNVDASGLSNPIDCHLIQKLRLKKLLYANAFGGVGVCKQDQRTNPGQNLFALGTLTKGEAPFVNYIPTTVNSAD